MICCSIFALDDLGRFDIRMPEFVCTICHNVTKTNIEECNMWRGDCSNQSSYLFDQDLFLFYDLLRKNVPGMSELGFVRTLEELSEDKGRVSNISVFINNHSRI